MLKHVTLIATLVPLITGHHDGSIYDSSLLRDERPRSLGPDIEKCTLYITKGTKWCGEETAGNENDVVGGMEDVDRCCRGRAQCKEIIDPGKEKYSVKNDHVYSIASCSCDEKFRDCLLKLNTEDSKYMLFKFFGAQHPECLKWKDDSKDEAELAPPVRVPTLAAEMDAGLFHFEPRWDEDKCKSG